MVHCVYFLFQHSISSKQKSELTVKGSGISDAGTPAVLVLVLSVCRVMTELNWNGIKLFKNCFSAVIHRNPSIAVSEEGAP